jgi:hypothetical protein
MEKSSKRDACVAKAGQWCVLAACFGIVLIPAAAVAHHSFAAEFDREKTITLTGSVTVFEWSNPHARFYLNVKDQGGNVINWEFELGSPNGLMRRGWTRNSLKPGDVVTVNGFLAKDGSHLANARSVVLSDGRKVFAGSSGDESPNQ